MQNGLNLKHNLTLSQWLLIVSRSSIPVSRSPSRRLPSDKLYRYQLLLTTRLGELVAFLRKCLPSMCRLIHLMNLKKTKTYRARVGRSYLEINTRTGTFIRHLRACRKCMIILYIAQCPVSYTAQGALRFTPGRPVLSEINSTATRSIQSCCNFCAKTIHSHFHHCL